MTTTFELPIEQLATSNPEDWAIQTTNATPPVSWSELWPAILRLALALQQADLGPDRRVLIVAGNRPATVVAHAGVMLGRASAVPVNYQLLPDEIRYIATRSGARVAFVDSSTTAATRQAVHGLDIRLIELPDYGVTGAEIDEFITSIGSDPKSGGTDPELTQLAPDQPVLLNLVFTSGTTGRPKAVQLQPRSIGSTGDLAGFLDHMKQIRLVNFGAHLVAAPLYHNAPLTAVRLLLCGVPIVLLERFDAASALATIEQYRIETSIMVPTHLIRMLALSDEIRAAYDVSSLKMMAHTGAKCPVDVKRAMIDWWGPVLLEAYGAAESSGLAAIDSADWLAHPGSVGRPLPPYQPLVVDENHVEVPPGTVGTLYFRDSTKRGIIYLDDPVRTADAHLEPGVFTLGDVGYVDEDGYIYLTDRLSDMVICEGVNIYPAEVQRVLTEHPDVVDAAGFGVDDAELGERLVAIADVRAEATITADDLMAWCRERIAGFRCPTEIRLVPEVPRNQMGKINKAALRSVFETDEQNAER